MKVARQQLTLVFIGIAAIVVLIPNWHIFTPNTSASTKPEIEISSIDYTLSGCNCPATHVIESTPFALPPNSQYTVSMTVGDAQSPSIGFVNGVFVSEGAAVIVSSQVQGDTNTCPGFHPNGQIPPSTALLPVQIPHGCDVTLFVTLQMPSYGYQGPIVLGVSVSA